MGAGIVIQDLGYIWIIESDFKRHMISVSFMHMV